MLNNQLHDVKYCRLRDSCWTVKLGNSSRLGAVGVPARIAILLYSAIGSLVERGCDSCWTVKLGNSSHIGAVGVPVRIAILQFSAVGSSVDFEALRIRVSSRNHGGSRSGEQRCRTAALCEAA